MWDEKLYLNYISEKAQTALQHTFTQSCKFKRKKVSVCVRAGWCVCVLCRSHFLLSENPRWKNNMCWKMTVCTACLQIIVFHPYYSDVQNVVINIVWIGDEKTSRAEVRFYMKLNMINLSFCSAFAQLCFSTECRIHLFILEVHPFISQPIY